MHTRKLFTFLFILILIVCSTFSTVLFASAVEEENKHFIGDTVNTGLDTGFSGSTAIVSEDPHWGWKLGEFFVTGYTRQTTEGMGHPVFLKNVGDTVTLWFELQQDIAKLNGQEKMAICEDTNGYDEYFGISQTNFKKGTLIIRHTDYQNKVHTPQIYTDYLSALSAGAEAVQVQLFEEGDYEVALNYEIKKQNWDIFGWDPFPEYYNYRIFFKFSVRNGNCMVYPFDTATGAELTNSAFTESGFSLDLAKSRYLDIDVKKSIRLEGADGLTEDTRFNKPAKDGEIFTDEGVYTITVHNKYTEQTTTKVIYVGKDNILKAHVVTGLPITEVEYQLSQGAVVATDGKLIPPPENTNEPNPTIPIWPFVVGGIFVVGAAIVLVLLKKKFSIPTENETFPESNGGTAQ